MKPAAPGDPLKNSVCDLRRLGRRPQAQNGIGVRHPEELFHAETDGGSVSKHCLAIGFESLPVTPFGPSIDQGAHHPPDPVRLRGAEHDHAPLLTVPL